MPVQTLEQFCMEQAPDQGPRTCALNALPARLRAPTAGPQATRRDFVIWFTARTGSTWLGSLLFSAGFPKPGEYFHPNKLVRIASYLGVNTWQDYVNSIARKRAKQGLFAHEMTFQFWDMLRNDGNAMSLLDFSGPSVVLYRQDIVAQAISICLAVKTNKWHRYAGGETGTLNLSEAYDEHLIRQRIDYIFQLEEGLKTYRDLLIPKARFLSYETLSANQPQTIVSAFGNHAGFDGLTGAKARSHYVPVRTSVNDEMRTLFVKNNRAFVEDIQDKRSWLLNNNAPLSGLR